MADEGIEINFPATVTLTRVEGDEWSAAITRKTEDTVIPITILEGYSPAEIFVKFGAKVEKQKIDKADAESGAVDLLSAALTRLGGRTIIPTSEVEDILLDIQNQLRLSNES